MEAAPEPPVAHAAPAADDGEPVFEPDAAPKQALALCLSGGGYRAMLFHAGALWRLNEASYLRKLDRVSSVSGGSIAAGVLACAWDDLDWQGDSAANFEELVIDKLRDLAGRTVDVWAILRGMFWFGSPGNQLARSYRRHLFPNQTLQSLPDTPRFIFNATSLQSGALWRFSKRDMADYRVGKVTKPDVQLATAVAASSAFPPFLSPLRMKLDPSKVGWFKGADLHRAPYTERAVLSDGGVYDNLGVEAAFKSCRTVLISDGGGKMKEQKRPWSNWAPQFIRVLKVIDNQVRSQRSRNAIADFQTPTWSGALWGIRTPISDFRSAPNKLPCDPKRTRDLAEIPTRLGRMSPEEQERLINWGYAVSDAALRAYVDKDIAEPQGFPYERGV